ncbi:MAG TPA: galactokinase [Candidatus Limnocylindrales bacterium]|nr:galactokinase [Candidatus Limnocylindrales bacterium]
MADSRDFAATFGRSFDVEASAPGRVNLIGEHTDYNGGAVLPLALPLRTTAQVARRRDDIVRVWSVELAGELVEFRLGAEQHCSDWADYVRGITSLLAKDGHALTGFDLRLTSQVPVGSGLSSSAALEVALVRALRELFSLAIDDVAIARLGQRVENDFVGARVGIMDQMAASLGDEHSALYLDTVTLDYEKVPVPPACEIAVLDTGVKHAHAGGGYNERRSQCEEAARRLGVRFLAELPVKEVARVESLPEPIRSRARHVITEHARVADAVTALRAGDLSEVGRLFYASHVSLRDDFEVSVPQLDFLVEAAAAQEGVYGARMTGGGFGGSAVVLTERGRASEIGHAILTAYAAEFPGCRGTLRVPA